MTTSNKPGNRPPDGPAIDLADMEAHAGEASNLLKAMASPHRLMVLCNLMDRELSVGELLEEIPLSASALSQHLAVLRREGLVSTRREAQTIYYSIARGPAREIISVLHEGFCAPAKPRRSSPS